MIKSGKIMYKNQKEIHNFIISELRSKYFDKVKEAYLIGSLANENFGKYKDSDQVSDIDVVIIPTEIPSEWKYEGEFYGWHKRYNIGKIKIKDTSHPISFIIPFEQKIKLFFEKTKELNWKIEKLK